MSKKNNVNNEKKINVIKGVRSIEKVGKKTFDEYKSFAFKGNILNLAIGVVIGNAFTNIVNSLVTGIITPFLGLLTNKVDLSSLFFVIGNTEYDTLEQAKKASALVVSYGTVLNAIINFFIVSFALFVVMRNIERINRKDKEKEEEEISKNTKECPYCKSDINIDATRCPNCTSILDDNIEKI